MSDIQKQCLFFVVLLACLLCFLSLPVSVCSQNLQSPASPPSSGKSDGASQKNGVEDFITQFNGCTWYKTPNDPARDVYLQLKDRILVLYEYLKDGDYCYMNSRVCFTQDKLWQMRVTGYDTTLTDRRGDAYQVVIEKDGKTIAIRSVGKTGGREDIIGTFVKLFCSNN